MVRVFGWLVLLGRSQASKDAEILCYGMRYGAPPPGGPAGPRLGRPRGPGGACPAAAHCGAGQSAGYAGNLAGLAPPCRPCSSTVQATAQWFVRLRAPEPGGRVRLGEVSQAGAYGRPDGGGLADAGTARHEQHGVGGVDGLALDWGRLLTHGFGRSIRTRGTQARSGQPRRAALGGNTLRAAYDGPEASRTGYIRRPCIDS
jgi:hypothetical protein